MKIQFDQLSEAVRERVINASEQYDFTISLFMELVNLCFSDAPPLSAAS